MAAARAIAAPHRPVQVPVFYSISTHERGLRLRRWLEQSTGWCHVQLPSFHPQDFELQWNGSTEAPVFVRAVEPPHKTLFVLRPPYGNLHNQIEKGHRRPRSGIAAAHKVANAAFHLRALECFATQCHPCVKEANIAAILEDDVDFVPGASPGTASEFPALLASVMARVGREGVNKLHLGVGNLGSGQEVNLPTRKARCAWHADVVQKKWAGARLLRCSNYSDSHAYVIRVAQARRIIAAQKVLVKADGEGRGRCLNPWGHVSCASDPSLFREFFKQCDRAPGPPTQRGACSGLALAGASNPWALFHNNSGSYRMRTETGTDAYGVMAKLQAALLQKAKREKRMRIPLAPLPGKKKGAARARAAI